MFVIIKLNDYLLTNEEKDKLMKHLWEYFGDIAPKDIIITNKDEE